MNEETSTSPPPGPPLLADILGRDRTITLFTTLTRETPSLPSPLSDPNTYTTVLSPLNSAIESLSHKPWEDSGEYKEFGEEAYEGDSGRARARRNVVRFVQAHYVRGNEWTEGVKRKAESGKEVWWEKKGGGKVILPDNIEVVKDSDKAANGELWIIKGVLKTA